MTYLSGLMLGASLANMARQMILGTGGRPAEGNILHGLGGGLFAASERSHGTHPHVLARTEAPSAMPASCAVPTAVMMARTPRGRRPRLLSAVAPARVWVSPRVRDGVLTVVLC